MNVYFFTFDYHCPTILIDWYLKDNFSHYIFGKSPSAVSYICIRKQYSALCCRCFSLADRAVVVHSLLPEQQNGNIKFVVVFLSFFLGFYSYTFSTYIPVCQEFMLSISRLVGEFEYEKWIKLKIGVLSGNESYGHKRAPHLMSSKFDKVYCMNGSNLFVNFFVGK